MKAKILLWAFVFVLLVNSVFAVNYTADLTANQRYEHSSTQSATAYNASFAFNDNITSSDGFLTASGQIVDGWLKVIFNQSRQIVYVTIRPQQDIVQPDRQPKYFRLEGSNDDSNYVNITPIAWTNCSLYLANETEMPLYGNINQTCNVTFSNPNSYVYYKVAMDENYGSTQYIGMKEIEMMEEYAAGGGDTPTFSSNSTNSTYVTVGDYLNMTVNISSDYPDYYSFAWNDTGSFINITTIFKYKDDQNVSVIQQVTGIGNVCYQAWANDTYGNTNTSDYYCFTSHNIVVNNSYPSDNSQFNTEYLSLNATVTSEYPYNCSLYINDTLNYSSLGHSAAETFVNFSLAFSSDTERDHTYYIMCNTSYGGSVTSTKTFYIDNAAPDVITNIEGNLSAFTLDFNLSVNVTDPKLKYISVNSSCNHSYFNGSILSSPFYYTNYTDIINCGIGVRQTNITVCDAPNGTLFNCKNYHYLWESKARLEIKAIDGVTSASLDNFSIYINGSFEGNTTTGTFNTYNLSSGAVNVTIDVGGYELKSHIVDISGANVTYTFLLYTANSLSVSIYSEDTGLPLLQNVSLQFSSIYSDFTNITNTSFFYIDNLNITDYNILFTSAGYSQRIYTVTIGNRTSQTLYVYLTNSSSTTIFTVTDKDTSLVLDNVFINMYIFINGSWAVIESKYTDVTGRSQFVYMTDTNYKFFLSRPDYDDYVFYLNPILFSTYDIKMTKTTLINYTQDYDQLSIIYGPESFPNNNITTFNFIIASPYGALIQYGINLTFPGGTSSDMGTNAIGGQLTASVNVSNASVYDVVQLDYYYITTLAGRRNFTILLPITFMNATRHTFMDNKDKQFGLGIFERMLVVTIIILCVAGIATLIGQPIAALALSLFIFAYTVYIGFIPVWAILPTMFIGMIFLIWKSGGY